METTPENLLVQFEHQAKPVDICEFVLLGAHEPYPPASYINTRTLFTKYADNSLNLFEGGVIQHRLDSA